MKRKSPRISATKIGSLARLNFFFFLQFYFGSNEYFAFTFFCYILWLYFYCVYLQIYDRITNWSSRLTNKLFQYFLLPFSIHGIFCILSRFLLFLFAIYCAKLCIARSRCISATEKKNERKRANKKLSSTRGKFYFHKFVKKVFSHLHSGSL